ncbi:hypothetical protein VTO73DRAFT_13101 [Trametes versicolor]
MPTSPRRSLCRPQSKAFPVRVAPARKATSPSVTHPRILSPQPLFTTAQRIASAPGTRAGALVSQIYVHHALAIRGGPQPHRRALRCGAGRRQPRIRLCWVAVCGLQTYAPFARPTSDGGASVAAPTGVSASAFRAVRNDD